MEGGKLEDGTPYVCIGADEPEAHEFVVHCKCPNCGKQHYFNIWKMFRGEVIACEHCGHESKATNRRRLVGGEWQRFDDETGKWVAEDELSE